MSKSEIQNPKGWNLAFAMAAVTMLMVVASTARAAEVTPSVQQWLAAQTNLITWSADVTQTRRLKTLAQPLVSTGHVWFAAPNSFRWEIGSPAQTIAVRNGDEMQVIYPRLKRVEKYPLTGEKMGRWKDTLALLEAGFPRNQADMERQFKIVSVSSSNDVDSLVLEPRSSAARKMMPRITVSFSTNDFILRATELQFGDGSAMRNDFRNGQLNPKIDEALFTPKLDAGFKVVEPMKR